MTKISTKTVYPIKKPVKSDYFVGSNSENFGQTVNFDFNDATKVINSINGESPISYKFKTSGNILLDVLTEAEFYSLGNKTNISEITKLYINKFTKDALNLTNLYNYLLINNADFLFKLRGTDPNIFVYFNLTSIENHSDYYLFNITLYKGNSSFSTLTSFSDYFFSFELKSAGAGTIPITRTSELINNGSNTINPFITAQDIPTIPSITGLATETYVDDADGLKLDKASYTGNATDIDNRIIVLENLNNLQTNFTGKAFAVWSGVGLIYDVIYPSYYIQGVLYSGATTQITLIASDPTNPRLDIIAVNSTGVIQINGIASASPATPTIDPDTQIEITTVLIDAGATTPTGVSNENVYKENTEWTTVSNNGTVNFNSTLSPFEGTKNIDCGAFTNGQYLRFTDSIVNQIADFSLLKFYVNLKATFATSAKFSVKFYNGSTLISSIVTVNSGTYNFLRTTINTYQTIVIPLSDFTFTGSNFNRIEIVMVGANTSGFRMDNVILSQGSGGSSPEQNAITSIITDSGIANATVKDDTFQFKGANGFIVSAIGKIITFTSLFTSALKINYDSAYTWFFTNGANVVSHLSNTSNPHSVTKTQVGLGNVDNTSDVNKPVSTAQATADTAILSSANAYTDGKVSSVYKFKGNVANYASLPSTSLTIGDVYNLTDTGANYAWTGTIWDNLGVTVDISGKADIASPTFTGVPSAPTATAGTNTTQLATTAFVLANVGSGISLSVANTWSAIQTFLDGKLGLRNVANTFTSYFTNTNTASRTYTLPDRTGTIADNTDLAGKQATLVSGTNIKTINGVSILGSGDIVISAGGEDLDITYPNTRTVRAIWNGFFTGDTYFVVTTGTGSNDGPINGGSTFSRKLLSSGTAGSSILVGDDNWFQIYQSFGFYVEMRISTLDNATEGNVRFLYGLASYLPIGNIDPSTITANFIGLGSDSSDTNCSIISKTTAETVQKIALGSSFPKTSNHSYQLIYKRLKGSANVDYYVKNITNGVTASGTIINTNPQTLTPKIWRNNGTGTTPVGVGITRIIIKNTDE